MASVRTTEMASIARTCGSGERVLITAIRKSAENTARPTATRAISFALGSDSAKATTRGPEPEQAEDRRGPNPA